VVALVGVREGGGEEDLLASVGGVRGKGISASWDRCVGVTRLSDQGKGKSHKERKFHT